ncbi:flavin reductase family protein [Neorhizobium alkalisoli]|jgi:flavin reductase (DIM6/NTAB) family NADH-FMN oxidoreductase RutF|uniref:Flavin reductase (DIM6/NTAB) family NADH-FMN oxidoreductase RutF n=1 Tax=Neorhizobium alkalisoli TaxID=528178 RepID=A0A561Q105_9HYPH|nr:flavin reductase family protein [Neorhizobium alkalisoli]TWF44030.1 flavin reductase (DIM6/NTAB) family NADH-FMN oxidoreductase RutF [Neorhizobium alkalisoli]
MIAPDVADLRQEHQFVPDAASARSFRNALGNFPTGVTVVTADTPNGPLGMTVNSFSSVSLDPPLVLWSPAKTSSRHDFFAGATHFAIHVLGADQGALSGRFTRGGLGFEELGWEKNPEGVPIIPGTLSRFECAQASIYDAGDHSIIVGRVLRAAHRDGEPLCFARGAFGRFAAAS